MKSKPTRKAPLLARLTSWTSLVWSPKTWKERTRENQELDEMNQEMEFTVSGLSPEFQAEIRSLEASSHPRDAEEKLLDYVVTDDHFTQLRKEARNGAFKEEGRMHDSVYWVAMVPVLIALYCIFCWLSTGHARAH